MLRRNLSRQGDVFKAAVSEIRDYEVLFEVDDEGFKKWGFARIDRNTPNLSPEMEISVKLEGFDRKENRFLFSLVDSEPVNTGATTSATP
jgi:hypothetical protein